MIPTDLAIKQAELLLKSQAKRRKQNRKNASGPRKQEKLRGSRRPLVDHIKDLIARGVATERYACYLVYAVDHLKRNEPIVTFQEFYKYREGEGPSDNPILSNFKIKDPTESPMEVVPA